MIDDLIYVLFYLWYVKVSSKNFQKVQYLHQIFVNWILRLKYSQILCCPNKDGEQKMPRVGHHQLRPLFPRESHMTSSPHRILVRQGLRLYPRILWRSKWGKFSIFFSNYFSSGNFFSVGIDVLETHTGVDLVKTSDKHLSNTLQSLTNTLTDLTWGSEKNLICQACLNIFSQ